MTADPTNHGESKMKFPEYYQLNSGDTRIGGITAPLPDAISSYLSYENSDRIPEFLADLITMLHSKGVITAEEIEDSLIGHEWTLAEKGDSP